MAPKKGSAKKAAAAPNKNWEAGLATAQLEEESWRACVCLVVGSSGEDEELMEALALAVQRPQRQLFTLLTWDNTLTKIHELGNPKTKKPDDVPMFYEVTESAMLLLDAGEEIPCDLMAKILKFQLLDIKARDQQRRAAKQANDEPDDGPQHYVLVLGFYQPQLLGLLDAIGVHVANVIKLCSEHRKTCEVRQEQQRTSEGNEQSQSMSPDLDAETKLSTDVDMRYYSNLLDLVPPEACSVPLILHCVLEQ
ncbi:putative sperm-associated antigen 17-like, partial [Scophthalmus maximus]